MGSSLLFFLFTPRCRSRFRDCASCPNSSPFSRKETATASDSRSRRERGGRLGNESLKFRTGLTKTTEKGGGGGVADFYRIYLASLCGLLLLYSGERGGWRTVANFLCCRNATLFSQMRIKECIESWSDRQTQEIRVRFGVNDVPGSPFPIFFCESSSSGSFSTEPDGRGLREGEKGKREGKNILHFTPSSKLSFVYTLFFSDTFSSRFRSLS